MSERKAVVKAMAARYRKASKRQKGRMLDELVALTGYHRGYAVQLLRGREKAILRVRRQGDCTARRARARVYDETVVLALKKIWVILDGIYGKRLAAILPEVVPILERYGELRLQTATRAKLLTISAATIDRLLAPGAAGCGYEHAPAPNPARS